MPYKQKKRITVLFSLFIILIIFHYTGIIRPLENIFVRTINPVAVRFYALGSGIRSSYAQKDSIENFQNKIKELESDRNSLLVEKSRLASLEEENEKLRQHLKFLTSGEYTYLMANLSSEDIIVGVDQNKRNIFINKGSVDGLYDGLPVLNQEGVMIGKISETRDSVSRICLTTSIDCRFAATIENSDQTIGLTSGDMGLTIKMDFIPQTEKVDSGDIVVSSGLERTIPRGLVIGRVTYVTGDINEIWKSATIEPIANINKASIVSVLIP